MPDHKKVTARKKLTTFSQIIFWSVISAAFIGPGTVTTALQAGADFKLDLLWAVIFSILACMVLQEASSRITIASGLTLGEAIHRKYGGGHQINLNSLLTAAIVFGCIAYQAGNLTGASEAVQLLSTIPKEYILSTISMAAALLMWKGKIKLITNILGLLVASMAILFTYLAWQSGISLHQLVHSAITPRIPVNSSVLIIGLVGTTIVPYNLFLGSGLSRDRDMHSTRRGLLPAIAIGGLITILILLTGSMLDGNFDFRTISSTFRDYLGEFGAYAFAAGLFAAGFTSSVTAPLAAAITVQSTRQKTHNPGKLSYRLTWLVVLGAGVVFSLMDYRPIMLIIIAQAVNGLILPFVAVSVYLVLNDRHIVPEAYANGTIYNLITLGVIGLTVFLGLHHLMNVLFRFIEINESNLINIALSAAISIILVLLLTFRTYSGRNNT